MHGWVVLRVITAEKSDRSRENAQISVNKD